MIYSHLFSSENPAVQCIILPNKYCSQFKVNWLGFHRTDLLFLLLFHLPLFLLTKNELCRLTHLLNTDQMRNISSNNCTHCNVPSILAQQQILSTIYLLFPQIFLLYGISRVDDVIKHFFKTKISLEQDEKLTKREGYSLFSKYF